MLDAFSHLAPLMELAAHYKRTNDDEPYAKKHKATQPPQKQEAMNAILVQLSKVVLHLDKEMQCLKRQDCFLYFMQIAGKGPFPLMTQEAKTWHTEVKEAKIDPGQNPLRTRLLTVLFRELQTRIDQMARCNPQDELWKTAVQKQTMTAAGEWPFLKWNPKTSQLQLDKRPPISMKRVQQIIQHVLELLLDPDNLIKFHSLRPQKETIPWLVQVNLRADPLWEELNNLTQNAVWQLLGCSMKRHSLQLSRPGQQLAEMTEMSRKGVGKGKSSKSRT